MSASPACIFSPVIASSFGNQPRAVPERSSSLTIPGRDAVSPPASVTRARAAASERDAPRAACTAGSGFGIAT